MREIRLCLGDRAISRPRRHENVADEYRVVIDEHERKDIDTITLIAERAPGADRSGEEVVPALRKELKRTTRLGFRINLRTASRWTVPN